MSPFNNEVNAGSRLTSNLSNFSTLVFGAPSTTASLQIDCSNAISYSLNFVAQSSGAVAGTLTYQLQFTDWLGNILALETIEVNCGINSTPTITYISDRCLGPVLNIYYIANTLVTGTIVSTVNISVLSVPCDRARITEVVSGATQSGDGVVGAYFENLAAAGVTSLRFFALTAGRIFLRCGVAETPVSTMLFSFTWGASKLNVFNLFKTSAATTTDLFLEIPATNRPLTLTVTNRGANLTSWGVSAWTSGV